jgi:aminomethyltransferase
MTESLCVTPLHPEHLRLGAKMVPFAGYDMPVQYPSGIIAETKAVRTDAGMFDVSHMARLRFSGGRVLEYLEWVTANDVAKLGNLQGQYSLLPNENGGCVDDIIVYRIHEGEYHMVVNAANHEKDVEHLRAHNRFGVELVDYTDETAMIAVQGPKAAERLAGLADDPQAFRDKGFFECARASFLGQEVFMARSGYTGEDGFEIICPSGFAPRLWRALAGAGVVPCGLGARDTLRVEAGLPLYGHELSDDLSPIAAGLGWVISKTKAFLGSEPIRRARESGTPTKLQGVRLRSRRIPPPGAPVRVGGRDVGEVTSGVYSPTLECGIGFAFVEPSIPLDTPCQVEVRGSWEDGVIVSKRFYKPAKG